MFANLNVWEIGALLLLALFIFGPERLPKVIGDAVRVIRTLRGMARNATNDLSRELGHEVNLEDLHPKTFIRKHLLSEEDEAELRRPFDDAYRDLRQISSDTTDYVNGRSQPAATPEPRHSEPTEAPYQDNTSYGNTANYPQHPEGGSGGAHRYDSDAT